jgi:hypothetical protein
VLLCGTRLDFVWVLAVSVTQVFEYVMQRKRKRPLTPLPHVRELVSKQVCGQANIGMHENRITECDRGSRRFHP